MNEVSKKRFVISRGMIGKELLITFTNKKGETYTYEHDAVYAANQEMLETMQCFIDYGNYTNSNKLPKWAQVS